MGCDLTIHVFEGISMLDIRKFFANHLGSKYFNLGFGRDYDGTLFERMTETPSIPIGEMSNLKAALTGDVGTYIPESLDQIQDIIGEDLPVIDDELIGKIEAAMGYENTTSYTIEEDKESVTKFLEQHRGKKVFTVCW